ncbi:MAG TPA: hypothetical protein VKN99_06320 [Polyangia bacterium]|nr:hypothetical protein [Polyangia bacterium]
MAAVPWPIWCAVLAVTSAIIGGQWDISWHRSIGRDTFWTPAHMAIYLCGVLAGLASGWLILSTTFARSQNARAASVRMWGLYGPLGAFIAAWGGVAMLTSAPFDNWWHAAYGLDVRIISPPHTLLALGVVAVQLGALILILGRMNRAQGAERRWLRALFLYVGGIMVAGQLTFILEFTDRSMMHSAIFYRVVALAIVLVLCALARAAGGRWPMTSMAAVYTVLTLAFEWILPLFPAEPKLGPVYQKVTHFIPNGFPILILAPALALDLLWARAGDLARWRLAAASGAVFLLALLLVQWPFGDFLMSEASRNWVFGTHYRSYFEHPGWYSARNLFQPYEHTRGQLWAGLAVALGCAMVTSFLGLLWGDWMRRIRR